MSSAESPSTSSSENGDPTALQPFTEIDFNEIHLRNAIGRGTYGLVQRANWRGLEVAVKIINTEMEKKAFVVELKQLQRVHHENIVKLYGACTRSRLCLVMEFMEGGSLHDFLHGNPKIPYTSGHAISWTTQCADAVAYLHGIRLVHRDLKPPNLLLTDHWRRLKVCDFGTVADLKTAMTNNRGSAAWMAPEVFSGTKYDDKCDVFSFGVILWECITRRKPYAELGGPAYRVMWKVYEGYRPPAVAGCPIPLEQLMKDCWHRESYLRPSMQQVHQLMQQLIKLFPGGEVPLKRVDLNATPEIMNTSQQPTLSDHHTQSPMSEASSALPDERGTPVTMQLRHTATPPRVNESNESLHSLPQSEATNGFLRGHNRRRGGSYETALLSTAEVGVGDDLLSAGGSTTVRRSSSSVLDRPKQLPLRPAPPAPPPLPPKPRRDAPPPPKPFEDGLASGGESAEASPIDERTFEALEPSLRPRPADPSSEESMRLYMENVALVDEYLETIRQNRRLEAKKAEMINSINRSLEHKNQKRQQEKLLSTKSDLQLKVNARSRANPVIDHR